MSEHETENSSSTSIMFEEAARRIKAVTAPLTQKMACLDELMCELIEEKSNRRHKEAASFRATSSSSGLTFTI